MAYRSRYAADRQPPRPSRFRIFLPSLMVLVLGIALAGAWAYTSWRTDREIDAWIVREASLGRLWRCPERHIGGFPFRIEASCDNPTFQGRAEGRDLSGGLRRILAVAQIYTPNLVIVEA